MAKEKELKDEYLLCQTRKVNAEELTKGLESESESWKEKEALNKERAKTVVGDCMLCSGIIAYLGAFPIDYRDDALSNWKRIL